MKKLCKYKVLHVTIFLLINLAVTLVFNVCTYIILNVIMLSDHKSNSGKKRRRRILVKIQLQNIIYFVLYLVT